MTTKATLLTDALAAIIGDFTDSAAKRSIVNVGGATVYDATLDRDVMHFDATNKYAYVAGASSVWLPTTTSTVCLWLKKDDATNRAAYSWGTDDNAGGGLITDWSAFMPWSDNVLYNYWGANSRRSLSGSGITWTNWNHFIFEVSSTHHRIYRNGTQIGEWSHSSPTRTASASVFGINTVGREGAVGSLAGDICKMADLCVFNRVLTSTERTWLADSANRMEQDPLSLSVSLSSSTVEDGETSTLTVTRSGGGPSLDVVESTDFESGLDGWTAVNAAASTSDAHDGSSSLLFDPYNVTSTLTKSVTLDSDGFIKFWAKRNYYYWQDGLVKIDGTTVYDFIAYAAMPTLGVWYQHSVAITAGTHTVQFYSRSDSENDGGHGVWLDEITIASASNTATDELTIALSSDDTDVATVPATLTIAAEATSGTGTVTAVGEGTAIITATYDAATDDVTITVTEAPHVADVSSIEFAIEINDVSAAVHRIAQPESIQCVIESGSVTAFQHRIANIDSIESLIEIAAVPVGLKAVVTSIECVWEMNSVTASQQIVAVAAARRTLLLEGGLALA